MKVSSRPRSFALSWTNVTKSIASISSRPWYFRIALTAAFRKYALLTPGISTGYWNAMNTPSRARSSGFIARRSLPSNRAWPPVTSYVRRPARTCASVVFPLPFGPMTAWTSPALIERSIPFRISLPVTFTCRSLISSVVSPPLRAARLPDRALEVQAHADQLLGLHGELHRELQEDLLAEAVHDHVRGVFRRDAARLAVEKLFLPDLRGRRLVLHLRRRFLDLDFRERERGARRADQKGIALAVVAGVRGALVDLHAPAVRVPAVAGGDAFRDDRAAGVLPDVQHLRARVGLLVVIHERDGVELADRVVSLEDAARVLPGDRGTGLDLRPGDLRVRAERLPALGDEVVDAALPVLVPGIPVLDRGVLDLRVVKGDQLDDRGVELVRVSDRGRAAFEIADVGAFVRDDEGALELAGVLRVDPEVCGEFHRAPHARRHVGERTVAEDGAVQAREEVVVEGHHGAQVFPHEIRVFLDRLGERAEDNPELREPVLERRRDGDAVEDRVDRDAGEAFLLLERDSELRVQVPDLRVDVLEAVDRLLRLWRGVVDDVLVVDRWIRDVRPLRLLHREPVAVRLQAPLEEPLGLVLLLRDEPDDVLVEALRRLVLIKVGDEAVLVLLLRHLLLDNALGNHGSGLPFSRSGVETITLLYISLVVCAANDAHPVPSARFAAEDLRQRPAFERVETRFA